MSDLQNNPSFKDDFPQADYNQWEAQLNKDLKGKPVNGIINQKSVSGFTYHAYGTSENKKGNPSINCRNVLQDKYPEFGQARFWYNRVTLNTENVKETNETALNLLKNGVNALVFEVATDELDLNALLQNIDLQYCEVSFKLKDATLTLGEKYLKNIDASVQSKITGTFIIENPNLLFEEGEMIGELRKLNKSEGFNVFHLNSGYFHNKGLSPVQEIAYSLSLLSDLIEVSGIAPAQILGNMEISSSCGTKYFEEIAKIKSFRYLLERFSEAYNLTIAQEQFKISSSGSGFFSAIQDEHNNMLRSVASAMAALLGGADAVSIDPYDSSFRGGNNFSSRIAKNISCLLSEESHFDKVSDPVAGSTIIESIIDKTVSEAWKLFLSIEEQGGYLALKENGTLNNLFKESTESWKKKLDSEEEILIGVNKFQGNTSFENAELQSFLDTESIAKEYINK